MVTYFLFENQEFIFSEIWSSLLQKTYQPTNLNTQIYSIRCSQMSHFIRMSSLRTFTPRCYQRIYDVAAKKIKNRCRPPDLTFRLKG